MSIQLVMEESDQDLFKDPIFAPGDFPYSALFIV